MGPLSFRPPHPFNNIVSDAYLVVHIMENSIALPELILSFVLSCQVCQVLLIFLPSVYPSSESSKQYNYTNTCSGKDNAFIRFTGIAVEGVTSRHRRVLKAATLEDLHSMNGDSA